MRHQRIKDLIINHINSIEELEIIDESHKHIGRSGQESHFKILLVSVEFKDQSRVQRQRLLNGLFAQEFSTGLHALSMRLLTPEEYNKKKIVFQSPNCGGAGK